MINRFRHLNSHSLAAFSVTASLILSACGGGGGSPGITPGDKQKVPVAVAQAGQSRALKGFNVTVTPFVSEGTANNQPTTVDVSVDNPNLLSPTDGAQFWEGDDYDQPANNVQIIPTSQAAPGKWQLTWPNQSKAESGLLIRFKLNNGDIIETAVGDFRFKK